MKEIPTEKTVRSGTARRVTLHDVAREAGCSVSAVSYAITHSRSLSRSLTERIQKAADRLGYRPYAVRRGTQRPWVVCLTGHTGSAMLPTLRRAFLKRGYFMMVLHFDHHEPLAGAGAEQLAALSRYAHVAGFLNLHPMIQSLDLLRCGHELPAVIQCREDSMLSEVVVPYHRYGEAAARQFCRIRHPKAALLMLTGDCNNEVLEKEKEGLLCYAPLTAQKIEVEICSFEHFDRRAVERQIERLYRSGVTALAAWHPDLAFAVEAWAYRRRIEIPRALSLFIYDPSGNARFMPPLSAIVPPVEELAEWTAENLCARIERRPFEPRTLEPVWVERGSTLPFSQTQPSDVR